ncbi:MAG: RNA polymerase sigma factor [Bacteroidia bacterium]
MASETNENEKATAAFFRLYEPVHANLNHFVKAMMHNSDDAKDIISDTVLTAADNFGKLRNQQAFLGFLFGIASRLIKRHYRKNKQTTELLKSEHDTLHSAENAPGSIDAAILRQALEELPPEQREAVVLFELMGFSLNEIVEIQQSSLSAVKSRVARGREKLRKLLTDKESATKSRKK